MPTPLYPICEAPQEFEEITMDDETTALDMSSSVAPDPFSTDTYMSVEGDPFSPYAPSDNAPIAFGMAAVMVEPISQRVQQWLDVLGTDDEGDKPRPTTSQIRNVFAQIERALKDGDPFKEGELEELRLAVVDPHRGDAPNLSAPALALEEMLQRTLLRTRAVNQLYAINYALGLRKYPDAYTLLTQIRPSELPSLGFQRQYFHAWERYYLAIDPGSTRAELAHAALSAIHSPFLTQEAQTILSGVRGNFEYYGEDGKALHTANLKILEAALREMGDVPSAAAEMSVYEMKWLLADLFGHRGELYYLMSEERRGSVEERLRVFRSHLSQRDLSVTQSSRIVAVLHDFKKHQGSIGPLPPELELFLLAEAKLNPERTGMTLEAVVGNLEQRLNARLSTEYVMWLRADMARRAPFAGQRYLRIK